MEPPPARPPANAPGPSAVPMKPPQPRRMRQRYTDPDSLWLEAWCDPLASAHVPSACIAFADLYADGDYKLLVAADRQLRIWKGTELLFNPPLMYEPSVVLTFYMEHSIPNTPCIAIASGPLIYIYKVLGTQLRPHCRFSMLPVEADAQETQVWDALRQGSLEAEAAQEQLRELRDQGIPLTPRSRALVALETAEDRTQHIDTHKGQDLVYRPPITCLASIRKSLEGETEPSNLVLGSEAGLVYVMESATSRILNKILLPSVPALISASGVYTVEYRLVVACRNGVIYSIRDGKLTQVSIHLGAQICGLVLLGREIFAATMNNQIHCFTLKGRKLYTFNVPAPIVDIKPMLMKKTRNFKGLLVALKNGELRIYSGSTLVNTSKSEPITGMCFGVLGREEGSLVTAHRSGMLLARMLPRQANLDAQSSQVGPPPEQDVPIEIPKKSALFLEQAAREKEACVDMHRIFQRDLIKLHLEAARSYLKLLQEGQGPLAGVLSATLQLTADVQGLGPQFKLRLCVENMSKEPVSSIPVVCEYNPDVYYVATPCPKIPLLLPGLVHVLQIDVECVDPAGGAEPIRVHLCAHGSTIPVLSAIVDMPMCEVLQEG